MRFPRLADRLKVIKLNFTWALLLFFTRRLKLIENKIWSIQTIFRKESKLFFDKFQQNFQQKLIFIYKHWKNLGKLVLKIEVDRWLPGDAKLIFSKFERKAG